MQIKKIEHNRPSTDWKESQAADLVIESGWLAQGKKTTEFENNFCNYLGIKNKCAVAVSNGTSALYISLLVLNLPKKSEIIIPSYTCSALLNAIYLADLTPIVADVNLIDFNLDISSVQEKVSSSTSAIIIPHTFGFPAKIEFFLSLKNKGVYLIEDCATAIGSKISNKPVGTLCDIAIYSFYASKFITTGNGGMIVSENEALIKSAFEYREFDGNNKYKKKFNFQMTDIQSSIGIEQLKKINLFLERRNVFAEQYKTLCFEKGWDFQHPQSLNILPNNYRFVLKLESSEVSELQVYLNNKNISAIIPIEKFELLHNYLKLQPNAYPNAELISSTTLSIPMYPALTDQEFSHVLKTLKKY